MPIVEQIHIEQSHVNNEIVQKQDEQMWQDQRSHVHVRILSFMFELMVNVELDKQVDAQFAPIEQHFQCVRGEPIEPLEEAECQRAQEQLAHKHFAKIKVDQCEQEELVDLVEI